MYHFYGKYFISEYIYIYIYIYIYKYIYLYIYIHIYFNYYIFDSFYNSLLYEFFEEIQLYFIYFMKYIMYEYRFRSTDTDILFINLVRVGSNSRYMNIL